MHCNRSGKVLMATVVLSLVSVVLGQTAQAEDLSGTYSSTHVIYEDSRLVGNVTCTMTTEPCIEFGASHIALRLNGFTITGSGNPDDASGASCNATSGNPPADGVRNSNHLTGEQFTDVQILGPGMVQKFRRMGIRIDGTVGVSTNVKVRRVTSHHNCFSGLLTVGMSESLIEDVVSVRNAAGSGVAACGGNCNNNSHNNLIRRNFFAGNGSVASGPSATEPFANDFGLGLLGNSGGNVVEDNTIGGNINGILIQPNASGNVIRHNTIAGNPPAQISREGFAGYDVRDEGADRTRNTFQDNWCVTYSGPGPAPCPNFRGAKSEQDEGGTSDDEDR
jgi:parallel beta-helix repeat protein